VSNCSAAEVLIVVDETIAVNGDSFGIGQFIELADHTLRDLNQHLVGSALPPLSTRILKEFKAGKLAQAFDDFDIVACMIFGHDGTGTTNSVDQNAFKKFIQERQGRCFATGDHARLGANLSGDLFGFRKLRTWDGPIAESSDSLDTRVRPSAAEVDTHPKPIFANWSWGPERRVHAVVDYCEEFPISFLPDHGHEGSLNLSPPKEDNWTVYDIAHAVVRTSRSNYCPQIVPILRIVEHSNGARLIADSTIHHWLNESWDGIASTNYLDQTRVYAQNILIHLLPQKYLEELGKSALVIANKNAKLREITQTDVLGRNASKAVWLQSPLLWRIWRSLVHNPVNHGSYDSCVCVRAPSMSGLNTEAIPTLPEGSFESELGRAMLQYRKGLQPFT